MSVFRALRTRYSKQCETKENHPDSDLKTRYYKGSFNQVFQAAEEIFKNDSNCRVTSVAKEHGEIAVEVKGNVPAFLIVTIITVKPYETAIDMNISTEKFSLAGFHRSLKNELLSFYKKFDERFTYIGSGKHAE
ncbi:hypothetical protein CVD25_16915 [Bacillus canaveralius]|uniref:Cytosolic protein n=1 Tax=Bacillus canaveralius TaxID=1403243 RepID=A0A2N5GJQ0_9BACI|nr:MULTISPECIES: hypothetical protein [Bacillus]PLR81498.1 hypothetical protein CU635_14875 [Bacillus canaveralius]PLR82357.1 hypothetical protein CVD23_17075 [Bacillus sp. V33-4]PLR93882.1 hypothetical protein CVD25_16915 [Bacillus canaveralius]